MFSERIERAIRLSVHAHAGQTRKADPGVPYATHPFHVALIVLRAGGDEDTVIAALLHDLLEDTDVTREDIDEAFGSRVADIVGEVSEDKTLSWEERKAATVERLKTASPEACLVAFADKIHNLETLAKAQAESGPSIWKAFRRGPERTLRFYREAYEVLRERLPAPLAEHLAKTLETAAMVFRD